MAAGKRGDSLTKAIACCCDNIFLFSQEQHLTSDCRLLKGPILESCGSLNSFQQLKWEIGSSADCHKDAFRSPLLLHSSGNLVVALAVCRLLQD